LPRCALRTISAADGIAASSGFMITPGRGFGSVEVDWDMTAIPGVAGKEKEEARLHSEPTLSYRENRAE